jgi:hypothetical protein
VKTIKGRSKKNYADKYDPNCIAMIVVFNYIYKIMVDKYGIISNMVGVSGESIGRYIRDYIPNVVGIRCKAAIMENDSSRAQRLKKNLNSHSSKVAKRTKVISGNIITYQDHPVVKDFMKTPARFLDLGLGIGILALTKMAKLMLFQQQKVRKYDLKKMVILDASRRAVSDQNQVQMLNDFLIEIDQKITTINGVDVSSTSSFMKGQLKGLNIFKRGQPFNEVKDEKNQPQRHIVTLTGNEKREAKLTLFTYRNGGDMLTVVLQYK